ncbi:MAG: FHA domain-containing protein [Aridibacter famidurans]|nr:FHA domain-containing protein [Aridibacter famidurans]
MIVCQACGSQNLDSSQYCDECGDSLQKYKAPEAADAADPSRNENAEEDIPLFQSASVTSVGIPPIEEETSVRKRPATEPDAPADGGPPAVSKKVHAKLVIERGHAIGTEFPLSSEESNIGRWDADNGVFPDVDLDAHDPEAKVSRRHARILFTNGSYMIEDLGSTNGTFVNRGRRLIPGNPQRLQDGDEVIVGKTFLRLVVLD